MFGHARSTKMSIALGSAVLCAALWTDAEALKIPPGVTTIQLRGEIAESCEALGLDTGIAVQIFVSYDASLASTDRQFCVAEFPASALSVRVAIGSSEWEFRSENATGPADFARISATPDVLSIEMDLHGIPADCFPHAGGAAQLRLIGCGPEYTCGAPMIPLTPNDVSFDGPCTLQVQVDGAETTFLSVAITSAWEIWSPAEAVAVSAESWGQVKGHFVPKD